MERILIDENLKHVEISLDSFKQMTKSINELITAYNTQPVLEKLTKKEKVFEFLAKPVKYFESAIYNDSEITVGKTKPIALKVAEMFNIDYEGIVRKIGSTNLSIVSKLKFDNNTLSLTDEAIKEIKESHKTYTQSDEEVRAYTMTKKVCDELNKYCDVFNIDSMSINTLSRNLNLSIKYDCNKPIFEVDYYYIKKILNDSVIKKHFT